jgi:hypothetical protein
VTNDVVVLEGNIYVAGEADEYFRELIVSIDNEMWEGKRLRGEEECDERLILFSRMDAGTKGNDRWNTSNANNKRWSRSRG